MTSQACLQHIFYEDGIPQELEQDLVRIYQNPFCTKEYIQISKCNGSLKAVALYNGEKCPQHIILYNHSGNELTVLNDLAKIEQEYLLYFIDTIFNSHQSINTISFNYLAEKIYNLQYPWHLWKTSQDIAIDLPQKMEMYHSRLGRQTKKHLRYYLRRLHREHPDLTFQAAATHEIEPSVIGKIIEMNRSRMKSKNIKSGYSASLEGRIVEFCRHYGLVSTVCIGDKIIAGTICYEVGNRVYLEAVSHDSVFNKYNAGQVCLYLTIKQAIREGKESFHMLWGKNEYKYRFRGVKHDLYFLTVYRSSFSKLLNFPKLVSHLYCKSLEQLDYLWRKYLLNWRSIVTKTVSKQYRQS